MRVVEADEASRCPQVESGFHIDVSRRLVYWRGTGMASVDALLASQAVLRSDARFEPTFSCIVDLLNADLMELSQADAKTLSGFSAFAPSARRVMVMSRAEYFRLGQLYQQHRLAGVHRDALVHVVHTLKSALDWLDLDNEALSARSWFDGPTREIVWTGQDYTFVEAMTAALGVLFDVSAAVSIARVDRSVRMFTIADRSLELSLIAHPNRVEARRKIIGGRSESTVDLSERTASAVQLQCRALVDRIQVRGL
jgi:hypothetical protein